MCPESDMVVVGQIRRTWKLEEVQNWMSLKADFQSFPTQILRFLQKIRI